MDPKTIGIGIIATAALVVAVAKPGAETKTLTVVAGGTAVDETAAEIVKAQPNVGERECCRQREGTVNGIVLRWYCDGARMVASVQTELDKMTTGVADATCVRFTPRQDGEKVALDATIQRGTLPNLDPVPQPPVAEEPKAEEAVGP